jgi:hypothetical protein
LPPSLQISANSTLGNGGRPWRPSMIFMPGSIAAGARLRLAML